MTEVTDLDLDVVSLTKRVKDTEDESVFYFRTDKGRVFIALQGEESCLIQGFLAAFLSAPSAMRIIAEAMDRYKDEALWCEKCELAFHIDNTDGVCPECGGKLEL